jgi:hypothetical protein
VATGIRALGGGGGVRTLRLPKELRRGLAWCNVRAVPHETNFGAMKTLSPEDIERLVGARPSSDHPLEILGYGFTSDGVRRFRAEQPDYLPQIVAHIRSVLIRAGIFPEGTNPDDAGFRTFIYSDGAHFRVSSTEEVGMGRYKRISTGPLPETDAINKYVHCPQPMW